MGATAPAHSQVMPWPASPSSLGEKPLFENFLSFLPATFQIHTVHQDQVTFLVTWFREKHCSKGWEQRDHTVLFAPRLYLRTLSLIKGSKSGGEEKKKKDKEDDDSNMMIACNIVEINVLPQIVKLLGDKTIENITYNLVRWTPQGWSRLPSGDAQGFLSAREETVQELNMGAWMLPCGVGIPRNLRNHKWNQGIPLK